jgi:hypothetical protein
MIRLGLLLLIIVGTCAAAETTTTVSADFPRNDRVRVTSPSNGDVVEPSFVLQYIAGIDVSLVVLDVDGVTHVVDVAAAKNHSDSDQTRDVLLSIESGRHRLKLMGLNSDAVVLSEHALTVYTSAGITTTPSLGFTSPADGSLVFNPVHFAVTGSNGFMSITVDADGLPLGEINAGSLLTYAFTDIGYARNITAIAWLDGEAVATDTIRITIEDDTNPVVSDFNNVVMEMVSGYPADGSYGYYWPSGSDWLGTTEDVWYLNTQVAEGDSQNRSFCVGLTWEVFMRAWTRIDNETGGDGTINGMTLSDLDSFRVDWFVRDLYGDGVVSAVENYGIGEQVTDWEAVRAGDFLQFWRYSGSGHNSIFVQWERDSAGSIEGVTYWSTQGSTNGISENTESFGSGGSSIDPAFFFVARVFMPDDWIDWRPAS